MTTKTTIIAASPKIAKDGRIMSPASLANLKPPYKPGQNGNPKPGNSLTARLKNKLLEPLREPGVDAPVAEHIIFKTLQGALEREPAPFHEVWDRTEGKVADKSEIKGEITLRIVDDNSDPRTDNPPA